MRDLARRIRASLVAEGWEREDVKRWPLAVGSWLWRDIARVNEEISMLEETEKPSMAELERAWE